MMNSMMKLILCAASMWTFFHVDAAAEEGESHFRRLNVYDGEISSAAMYHYFSYLHDNIDLNMTGTMTSCGPTSKASTQFIFTTVVKMGQVKCLMLKSPISHNSCYCGRAMSTAMATAT